VCTPTKVCTILNSYSGQPRGYSEFQDRDDQMAAKFKTQNISSGLSAKPEKFTGPKMNSQKFLCQISDL